VLDKLKILITGRNFDPFTHLYSSFKTLQVTLTERNKARQQATLMRSQQASGTQQQGAAPPQQQLVYAHAGAT